jgi:HAD superfamily hydrolase (TIGR01509 family)
LIFDVDGTLADTERDGHRVAFNQAFADAGLDWHWDVELYGDLLRISGGKERMHRYLAERDHNYDRKNADSLIVNLHRAKNQLYSEMLQQGLISLRPGVNRLLSEALDSDLRLAIATTTSRVNVIKLLEKTLHPEAPSWFEIIATADEIPDKKPSPAVYDYVLEQMGLDASQSLAFEDSENGLTAAQQAAIPTIITVNDYTRNGDYSMALLVLSDLGEPEHPFEILGGKAAGTIPGRNGYVTVDLLRELHRLGQPYEK